MKRSAVTVVMDETVDTGDEEQCVSTTSNQKKCVKKPKIILSPMSDDNDDGNEQVCSGNLTTIVTTQSNLRQPSVPQLIPSQTTTTVTDAAVVDSFDSANFDWNENYFVNNLSEQPSTFNTKTPDELTTSSSQDYWIKQYELSQRNVYTLQKQLYQLQNYHYRCCKNNIGSKETTIGASDNKPGQTFSSSPFVDRSTTATGITFNATSEAYINGSPLKVSSSAMLHELPLKTALLTNIDVTSDNNDGGAHKASSTNVPTSSCIDKFIEESTPDPTDSSFKKGMDSQKITPLNEIQIPGHNCKSAFAIVTPKSPTSRSLPNVPAVAEDSKKRQLSQRYVRHSRPTTTNYNNPPNSTVNLEQVNCYFKPIEPPPRSSKVFLPSSQSPYILPLSSSSSHNHQLWPSSSFLSTTTATTASTTNNSTNSTMMSTVYPSTGTFHFRTSNGGGSSSLSTKPFFAYELFSTSSVQWEDLQNRRAITQRYFPIQHRQQPRFQQPYYHHQQQHHHHHQQQRQQHHEEQYQHQRYDDGPSRLSSSKRCTTFNDLTFPITMNQNYFPQQEVPTAATILTTTSKPPPPPLHFLTPFNKPTVATTNNTQNLSDVCNNKKSPSGTKTTTIRRKANVEATSLAVPLDCSMKCPEETGDKNYRLLEYMEHFTFLDDLTEFIDPKSSVEAIYTSRRECALSLIEECVSVDVKLNSSTIKTILQLALTDSVGSNSAGTRGFGDFVSTVITDKIGAILLEKLVNAEKNGCNMESVRFLSHVIDNQDIIQFISFLFDFYISYMPTSADWANYKANRNVKCLNVFINNWLNFRFSKLNNFKL